MSRLLLTSGRGPGECRIAVAGLAEALCAEAHEAGIEAEVIDAQECKPASRGAVATDSSDMRHPCATARPRSGQDGLLDDTRGLIEPIRRSASGVPRPAGPA